MSERRDVDGLLRIVGKDRSAHTPEEIADAETQLREMIVAQAELLQSRRSVGRDPTERVARTREEVAILGWACLGMPISFAFVWAVWLFMDWKLRTLLTFAPIALPFVVLGIAFRTVARGLESRREWTRRLMGVLCGAGVVLVAVILYGANAGFVSLIMTHWRPEALVVGAGVFGLLSVSLFAVYCAKAIRALKFWTSNEVKALFR